MLEGALAFGMLALLQWFVSRLSVASSWFGNLVRSQPKLLVENGRYRPDALASERMIVPEVDAAIRSAGLGRLEDVAAVVLETDGSMSVIRCSDENLTALGSVKR